MISSHVGSPTHSLARAGWLLPPWDGCSWRTDCERNTVPSNGAPFVADY